MNKPNIIFILIDDLGWRDLSCTGSAFYETPHIDRLAAEGMLFTDAYAACPVCSPTRASILTGKYPATVGITDWIDWSNHLHPCRGRLVDVPYLKQLPLSEKTVAAALRDGGYETWHLGKWHLGGPGHYPHLFGFDVNVGGNEFGHPHQGYFSPWDLPNLKDGPEGEYLGDRLTDEAIALIENRQDRPFFMNLCYYEVHTPIQAKPEKIEKYHEKAKRLGLDKQKTFEEGDFFPTEHKRHLRIQRRLIQSHPVYAAMIENLDENIGRLLDALDRQQLSKNTLVIFTSDNGGLATAEGSPTSNLPLAEGKGWMYEGGTREPLLIRWPGVVAAGSTCSEPITSPDFYPTLLSAAGLPPLPDQHVDGTNLMPLLTGAGDFPDRPIFWHYPHYGNQGGTPGSSVRLGDLKLIEFFEDNRLELYHLQDDPGEHQNLAESEPDLVRALHQQLINWRDSVEAKIPAPNPEWGDR